MDVKGNILIWPYTRGIVTHSYTYTNIYIEPIELYGKTLKGVLNIPYKENS